MKRVHAVASFCYANADHKEDFEFDDECTDAEIEEEIWEWAQSFLDVAYEIEEEEE